MPSNSSSKKKAFFLEKPTGTKKISIQASILRNVKKERIEEINRKRREEEENKRKEQVVNRFYCSLSSNLASFRENFSSQLTIFFIMQAKELIGTEMELQVVIEPEMNSEGTVNKRKREQR
jgi:hypothetical protein